MKLRFHDNSLRLRLSQSEVELLKAAGRVEDTITFGPGQELIYSIESSPVPAVAASFEDGRVRLVVPSALARQWLESDQTGVENSGSPLRVLIEKDFQCLHRSSEEDRDSFPNPLAPT